MYAVIRTGGKQYKVSENDVLAVEKLAGDAGSELTFPDVLALHDGTELKVGAPLIDGAVVTADVLDQSRADKILVFKKKRRQNYRRTKGHRQHETVIRITGILADGKKKAAAKASAPKDGQAESAPAAEAPKAEARTEAPKAETKAASEPKAAPKKKAPASKPAEKKE